MIRLDPSQYRQVHPLLDTIPTNTLLARMILDGNSQGVVYADSTRSPAVCLFRHSSGLNFLFGSNGNTAFNRRLAADFLLKSHKRTAYLLVYPAQWKDTLSQLAADRIVPVALSAAPSGNSFSNCIIQDSRLNFRFNTAQDYGNPTLPSPEFSLHRINRELFNKLEGTVLPNVYWKDFDTFDSIGGGYCLARGVDIVSFSFCSSRVGFRFELGVETYPQYRFQGLGIHACSALIHYCLENSLEPVWGCRTTNLGSVALAKKLGFEIIEELPYYRLMNAQELNPLLTPD